ncbi:unnamed protein product, partial [Protopolystoma xenopodis]
MTSPKRGIIFAEAPGLRISALRFALPGDESSPAIEGVQQGFVENHTRKPDSSRRPDSHVTAQPRSVEVIRMVPVIRHLAINGICFYEEEEEVGRFKRRSVGRPDEESSDVLYHPSKRCKVCKFNETNRPPPNSSSRRAFASIPTLDLSTRRSRDVTASSLSLSLQPNHSLPLRVHFSVDAKSSNKTFQLARPNHGLRLGRIRAPRAISTDAPRDLFELILAAAVTLTRADCGLNLHTTFHLYGRFRIGLAFKPIFTSPSITWPETGRRDHSLNPGLVQTRANGLLLAVRGRADYLALELVDGRVRLAFDMGKGAQEAWLPDAPFRPNAGELKERHKGAAVKEESEDSSENNKRESKKI